MSHICHITTVHNQHDTRIFWKECRSLAKAGHVCTLLVLNGTSEVIDNVTIIGVPCEIKSRLSRIFKGGNVILHKAIAIDADLYHLHDPELLRIARKLKRKTNAKVIYDSHEDLPKQVLDKKWIPQFLRNVVSLFVAYFEKKVTGSLDGVISVTENICNRFKKYNKNVELIANYPIIEEMDIYHDPTTEKQNGQICYVGGLFPTRGIYQLVQALELCEANLLLAGEFSSVEFKEKVTSLPGWKKVNYIGQVDRKSIVKVFESSQIGIVTLNPTPSYIESLPIKLFEYMAAGLPVIASNFKMWEPLVKGNECGLMVDPDNPEEIAKAIDTLLNNPEISNQMGKNGYKAVREKYSWNSQADKLIHFYSKLLR